MPESVCLIEDFLKNSAVTQMLLFMDGIVVTRYIFIFHLKNPAAFDDQFWELFVAVWIVGFSVISQFVFAVWPGSEGLKMATLIEYIIEFF